MGGGRWGGAGKYGARIGGVGGVCEKIIIEEYQLENRDQQDGR